VAESVAFDGLTEAFSVPETKIRLFGKPDTRPGRRMGVALSLGRDTDEARQRAEKAAHAVTLVME
jgi:phosphoribosylglycinamide formyltransferase 2